MPKSIPYKKWIRFLKSLGLKHIRTDSSHEIYDYPEKPMIRPVTVDKNYPDVPLTHIHTTLKTLGISKKEFMEMMKNN
jgi:predicted RNA binding protein YcfA (HicA-like mRNA interferase family)